MQYYHPGLVHEPYLLSTGGRLTGRLDMAGHSIMNVKPGTLPGDVTTKSYVDSLITGLENRILELENKVITLETTIASQSDDLTILEDKTSGLVADGGTENFVAVSGDSTFTLTEDGLVIS